MTKKVEISDGQYDWLMARGRFKSTPSRVLEGVIDLVKRIEADQAKYKAWIAASLGKKEAEEKIEDEKGGEKDACCLDGDAD